MVRHWESLVAEWEGGRQQQRQRRNGEDCGEDNTGTRQRKTAGGGGARKTDGEVGILLCGQQASGFHIPGWIQSAFDTLMGLFDQVGLRINIHKTVGMVCRPFRTSGVRADKAYTRRMEGDGQSFKERQWERVLCPECGKETAKGSLVAHRQNQNGVEKGGLG